jgi:hypothetical protein
LSRSRLPSLGRVTGLHGPQLAKSSTPKELADHAYSLYERFRPAIPEGVKG